MRSSYRKNDQIKRIICKQFSDHCFIRLPPDNCRHAGNRGTILPRQFIQIINSQEGITLAN